MTEKKQSINEALEEYNYPYDFETDWPIYIVSESSNAFALFNNYDHMQRTYGEALKDGSKIEAISVENIGNSRNGKYKIWVK